MYIDLNDQLYQHKEDDIFEQEINNNHAFQILDVKYKQVDTNNYVAVYQKHLNINQLHKLQQVLCIYGKLFDVLLMSILTK